MFIALNGQRLTDANPAGPEKYTYNIYNALSKIDNKNCYVIYFAKDPGKQYFQEMTNSNRNFSYKVFESKISWTQHGLSKQLFNDRPDVFFTPVHTLPIIRPQETKYISMVHGLEFSHIKPKNLLRLLALGKTEKYVCQHSDLLIVPSDATKKAIMDKGWRDEKDITVVSEGVDKEFYKRDESEIQKIRAKYKLGSSSYLLFIGTIHPRKNLQRTIEAFSRAMKELNDSDTKFVIAGKLGWDYEKILEAPAKQGITNRVLFAGRVPDEDRPPLLSGSKALVNFSVEEGFGLPLLEAMACETPVAISTIPPFKEVCADLAVFVDPYNIDDIKVSMINVLGNRDEVKIQEAKNRSKMFSWEKSAEKTLAIFESILKNS